MRLPKLFIFANDKATFNKDELVFIREFKAVIERDKVKGRPTAAKEFVFIYFMADYESPYVDLDEPTKRTKAKADAELPTEWGQDSIVTNAIRKYKELQYTPAIKSIVELKNSFNNVNQTISVINAQNTYLLEDCAKKLEAYKSDESKMMELTTTNGMIVDNLIRLTKLSENIEKAIKNIDEVQKRVLKEVAEAKVWGGSSVGNRELAPGQEIKEH